MSLSLGDKYLIIVYIVPLDILYTGTMSIGHVDTEELISNRNLNSTLFFIKIQSKIKYVIVLIFYL